MITAAEKSMLPSPSKSSATRTVAPATGPPLSMTTPVIAETGSVGKGSRLRCRRTGSAAAPRGGALTVTLLSPRWYPAAATATR